MKLCIRCKKEKPENKFYSYGFNICKQCRIEMSTKWRKEHPEKAKQYAKRKALYQAKYYKEWYAKNGRKRSSNYTDIMLVWRKNNKEKIKVSQRVRYAIKKGLITKPLQCSICGRESRIHAHHEDYEKPLDVIWVCASCHKKIHLGKILVDI
jgi:uncharacterized LabA/DUF88 family protein